MLRRRMVRYGDRPCLQGTVAVFRFDTMMKRSAELTMPKISRESMKDRLVVSLRAEILGGNLKPSTRITETELCERYGVSRSVVREALMELGRQGLVVSTPYKGTEIASISRREVAELLIPLRIHIEQFALRISLHAWSQDHFDQLAKALDGMKTGVAMHDVARFNDEDFKFHSLIVSASSSSMALNVWETISQRIIMHFGLQTGRTGALPRFYDDHAQLLEVLRTQDLDKSLLAIEDHIRGTNLPLLDLLDD